MADGGFVLSTGLGRLVAVRPPAGGSDGGSSDSGAALEPRDLPRAPTGLAWDNHLRAL